MAHPCFQMKKSKNGDFYFCLTAKNGQIIAQSEMYSSRSACENGIRSVQENAPAADIDDQTQAA
ncbi:MAG: YegP family protein [Rhodospirillales bacterium]|nr:YegP family protein [Rhodospirillales bacterium]